MYNSLSYKTKQFFWLMIKLSIVIGCGYFIWQKLNNNSHLSFSEFYKTLTDNNILSFKNCLILLFLSFLNWFLEIKKWHTLLLFIDDFSLLSATKQSLASLTASLVTPNRIGEYGAKAMYFKKQLRKQVVGLNFIGNFYQLLATLFFGGIGCILFSTKHAILFNSPSFYGSLLLFFILITTCYFLIKKSSIGLQYVNKIKTFLHKIPLQLNVKVGLLSFGRFVIFTHQFYFLLLIFKADISYINALIAITTTYLIASTIPMWSFLDVVLKGTVAVWVFSFLQVPSLNILSITTLMWFFNFVIPALIGCYFVITFKPNISV